MAYKWLKGTFRESTTTYRDDDYVPISETASHHEFGFMTALPSDILAEIFSHVDQDDSLECMAVCRYWYNAIPQYTQNLWKELRLHTRDAYMDHRRRERCLGRHVKAVTLKPPMSNFQVEEREVHILIQKILEWGCTNIKTFALSSCTTTDQVMFIGLLKPLAPYLTHMEMKNHMSEVDIPYILYNLPNLTHLTYQYRYGTSRNVFSTALSSTVPNDYYANIIYLWLDVDLSEEHKGSILSRCPNLRTFIDTNRGLEMSSSIDLDLLFSWCPKINFLETCLLSQNQRPDTYTNDLPGLRLYNTSADYGFDQVVRHLTRNQDTLEFLSIFRGRTRNDWSRAFRSLQLPKLHTLVSLLNYFTADALGSMLSHCPALVMLKLDCAHPRLTLDPTTIQYFHTMYNLQYLQCGGIDLDDRLSLLTILGRFPNLQHLFIYRSSISLAPLLNFEGLRRLKYLGMNRISWKYSGNSDRVAQFFRCLTNNSEIEYIHLVEVPNIDRSTLLAIANLPTLKYLDIQLDENLSNEGFLEFIIALRETAIDTLMLRCTRYLPFAILDALSELPKLSMFSTKVIPLSQHYITFVDKDGLEHMLNKSLNLTAVVFHDSTAVKDGEHALTQHQIHSLISRQTSQYNICHAKVGGWTMSVDDHSSNNTILRRLTIRCADRKPLSFSPQDPLVGKVF